jgi:hypothetical protein
MINDAFGGDKYLSLGRKIYVLAWLPYYLDNFIGQT